MQLEVVVELEVFDVFQNRGELPFIFAMSFPQPFHAIVTCQHN